MRVIPDDVPSALTPSGQFVVWNKYVIEITDAEWVDIYCKYPKWREKVGNRLRSFGFATYLKELIELKRAGK